MLFTSGNRPANMSRPIITLTTDFGAASPYVAQMKGVILSRNPDATVVDVTHAVPPQDVRQGARVLEEVCPHFPAGSVHVAVVDPGVGTPRRIVCASMAARFYVAPDNGLLSRLARRTRPSLVVSATNEKFWREEVSRTFHGRDIMAPLAAALTQGVDPAEFGPAVDDLVELAWPEVEIGERSLRAEVVSVDSFGNLITDVTAAQLHGAAGDAPLRIECGGRPTSGLVRSYAEAAGGSLVALIGSSGRLEIAVVNGDAGRELGVEPGEQVLITW